MCSHVERLLKGDCQIEFLFRAETIHDRNFGSIDVDPEQVFLAVTICISKSFEIGGQCPHQRGWTVARQGLNVRCAEGLEARQLHEKLQLGADRRRLIPFA